MRDPLGLRYDVQMKRCSKCGEEKALEEFPARHGKPLARCLGCHREAQREYSRRNREKRPRSKAVLAEQRRQLRAQNLERERATQRAYWRQRPERRKQHAKRYYEANRPKLLAAVAEWAKANPEYARAKAAARRARKKGNPGAVPIDRQAIWDRDAGVCGICRQQVEGPWDLDHIVPLSLGGAHAPCNVQVAHPTCNREKWANLEGQLHFAA